MPTLDRITARLRGQFERLAWKQDRMMRPGTATEYDPATHTAKVRLNSGDGEPFLSPRCSIIESAGAGTSKTTLSEGQTCWLMCPGGDLRSAKIMAGDFSDQFKSSSTAADETRFERGNVSLAIRPGEAEMTSGDTTVTVKDGHVRVHTSGSADFD